MKNDTKMTLIQNNFSTFSFLCLQSFKIIAVTFTTDASNKNPTDSDAQQFITNDQHQMSENLTGIEFIPMTASLVQQKHESENELEENEGVGVGVGVGDAVDAGAVATVVPVSTIVSTKLSNKTQTTDTEMMHKHIQATSILQRNATVSRDQLNSRAVIKSSSTSAIANNNTTNQKQQKPDAPMLNYIFDSHLANKHRHYDPRYVYILPSPPQEDDIE